MENIIVKMFSTTGTKLFDSCSRKYYPLLRCYSTGRPDTKDKPRILHPYRKIHPWKSVEEFSASLVKGVIHNAGDLVAVNKPYGIAGRMAADPEKCVTGIVNNVDYTLADAAPHLASALGYSTLSLIKSPEKYMSGVAIYAASTKVVEAVEKALVRAPGSGIVPKKYWIVTTRVPHEIKGEMRLAMTMKQDMATQMRQPVIVSSWSNRERKSRAVKILNVQFNVLSNSTNNLSSLIEINSSTTQWHAIRLFAVNVLYSPILGDKKYGSRIKNVLGKWMNISPFVEAAREPPKLDKELLAILKIKPGHENIIPAHIHLREIYLPLYVSKTQSLTLTAPPMPEFMWTCKQLKFKHEIFKDDLDNDSEMTLKEYSLKTQAVT